MTDGVTDADSRWVTPPDAYWVTPEGPRRHTRVPNPPPDLQLTEEERTELDALSARVRWDRALLGLDPFAALGDGQLARFEALVKCSHVVDG